MDEIEYYLEIGSARPTDELDIKFRERKEETKIFFLLK